MEEMEEAMDGMPNWNAVGPDFLPIEFLRFGDFDFRRPFHCVLVSEW